MCGIAGVLNMDISVSKLLSAQSYRGPDSTDIKEITVNKNNKLWFGHNRLKIISLADEANQPFIDRLTGSHIVFNGEIYNYKEIRSELKNLGFVFKTDSDTEVLLTSMIHWGEDAFSKLDGMFAFAFFDNIKKKLILARDRFGVKPLYYYLEKNRLAFASSSNMIATLLKLGPNFKFLNRGLKFGIYELFDEYTVYENLFSLLPGHFLELDLHSEMKVSKKQYYDFNSRVIAKKEELNHLKKQSVIDLVTNSFTEACSKRLVADVPVTMALSGGLDSSAIASVIQNKMTDFRVFTFGDPHYKRSEGELVRQFCTDKDISVVFVNPGKDVWVNSFWETLEIQDEPFAGLSVVAQYILYKKIREYGYKVALGGQGGDEGFLGYRKFQLFYLRELINSRSIVKSISFVVSVMKLLSAEFYQISKYVKIKNRYLNVGGMRSNLLLNADDENLDIGYTGDITNRQIDDILNYSLPTLLRYEDKNSMANSIETRLPFLDYRLLEIGCALPVGLKLKNGYGKWILRNILSDQINKKICWARYKRGFDIWDAKKIYSYLYPSLQNEIRQHYEYYSLIFKNSPLLEYFTPEMLVKYPNRFVELTTALWLRKHA